MMRQILDRALTLFERESYTPQLFGPGTPSLSDPPAKPGLYRMIRKDDGTIRYIGQTSDLAKRIREQRKRFPEDEYAAAWMAIVPCFTNEAYDLLRDMERKHIDRHRPECNATRGREGSPPRTERCERRFRPCRNPGECRRWPGRS